MSATVSATLNPTRYQVYNSPCSMFLKVGVKLQSLAQIGCVSLAVSYCCTSVKAAQVGYPASANHSTPSALSTRCSMKHPFAVCSRVLKAENVGFMQMYPLWLLATKDTGGLQWSVPKVGKVKITCPGHRVAGRFSFPKLRENKPCVLHELCGQAEYSSSLLLLSGMKQLGFFVACE